MTTPSQPDATQARSLRPSNLWVRVITTLIGLPITIWAVVSGGWAIVAVTLLLVVIGSVEFFYMERSRGTQNNVLLGLLMAVGVLAAFVLESAVLLLAVLLIGGVLTFVVEFWHCRQPSKCIWRVVTTLGGVFYVAFPGGMALAIRGDSLLGLQWFLAVLGTTWSVDTFSFLSGRLLGKRPLFPQISPKKTVEGAIGGVLFGIAIPAFLLNRAQLLTPDVAAFLVVAAFLAVAGDFLESVIKRFFGVKDSGVPGFNLFPGHGGVLDRVDALLVVIAAYYIFLALTGRLAVI